MSQPGIIKPTKLSRGRRSWFIFFRRSWPAPWWTSTSATRSSWRWAGLFSWTTRLAWRARSTGRTPWWWSATFAASWTWSRTWSSPSENTTVRYWRVSFNRYNMKIIKLQNKYQICESKTTNGLNWKIIRDDEAGRRGHYQIENEIRFSGVKKNKILIITFRV